jgi:hypothetical protein
VTRKRRHRRITIPLPPRGLRPMLDRSQLTDLGLAHLANLDALAHGQADATTLWHAVEAAYTWSRVAQLLRHLGLAGAQLLHTGEAEMAQQLAMLEHVIQRYKRTGRIGLSGPEYQLAKAGVDIMDELARLVDLPTAVAAAAWSEARLDAIHAEMAAESAAA